MHYSMLKSGGFCVWFVKYCKARLSAKRLMISILIRVASAPRTLVNSVSTATLVFLIIDWISSLICNDVRSAYRCQRLVLGSKGQELSVYTSAFVIKQSVLV